MTTDDTITDDPEIQGARAELDRLNAECEATRLDVQRWHLIRQYELDPDLIEFLSATDYDKLTRQAEHLRDMLADRPRPDGLSKHGNFVPGGAPARSEPKPRSSRLPWWL